MEQENASSPSGAHGSAIVITKEDIKRSPAPVRQATAVPSRTSVSEPAQSPRAYEGVLASVVPAGFWLRLLAKLLDVIVTALFYIVTSAACGAFVYFGYLGNSFPAWEQARPLLSRFVWMLLAGYVLFYAAYSVLMHAADGRTIGKTICGIRVTAASRPLANTWVALPYYTARFLAAVISIVLLCVGHILSGFRRDKRALHDLSVGSRVIKELPSDTQE